MKITISLFLIAILICVPGFFSLPIASAQTASPSANLDVITQNVKKRLQAIAQVRGSVLDTPQHIVYTGMLLDRSNNILTIRHNNQNLLASTSASTSMIRVPGSTRINLDDLVLEENIATIGQVNEDRVMISKQVIVQAKAPASPIHQTIVGNLVTYDSRRFVLTIQPPQSQQPLIIDLNTKTKIFALESDSTRTPVARTNAMATPSKLLVIYSPPAPDEDITATEILISPL